MSLDHSTSCPQPWYGTAELYMFKDATRNITRYEINDNTKNLVSVVYKYFTADIKVLTLSFFNKCISSPNEKWLKVYTYKNWWVFFKRFTYMYFLWKHFVSVSSNRQSVVWLSCDTDSRISLYRLTYYYICSKRDAWNRALPFIALHVCSHVIWRCTKWVPITSGVLTRQGTSITHTNDVARLPSGSLCCVPTGRSCNVQIVD